MIKPNKKKKVDNRINHLTNILDRIVIDSGYEIINDDYDINIRYNIPNTKDAANILQEQFNNIRINNPEFIFNSVNILMCGFKASINNNKISIILYCLYAGEYSDMFFVSIGVNTPLNLKKINQDYSSMEVIES